MVNNLEIGADGREAPVVGVDGCKGGWIAVSIAADATGAARAEIFRGFRNFERLVDAYAPEVIIAVDMPIGLPERAVRGGREPDWAAREFLKPRSATVFPVPSRAAVEAFDESVPREKNYAQACAIARKTSEPSKAFSIQAFSIFPRIQQIDCLLRADAKLQDRVFEVHPEVSFALMNGGQPLEPKKIKGRINESGMKQRKALLARQGFAMDFLEDLNFLEEKPRGAGRDDFYDACACAWSARRILRGEVRVFPPQPEMVDAHGLRVAIRG